MKESQAWRKLAESYERRKKNGTGSSFLCINIRYGRLGFDYDLKGKMTDRIQMVLDPEYDGIAYPQETPEGEATGGRVLACLMFAQQAADEEATV